MYVKTPSRLIPQSVTQQARELSRSNVASVRPNIPVPIQRKPPLPAPMPVPVVANSVRQPGSQQNFVLQSQSQLENSLNLPSASLVSKEVNALLDRQWANFKFDPSASALPQPKPAEAYGLILPEQFSFNSFNFSFNEFSGVPHSIFSSPLTSYYNPYGFDASLSLPYFGGFF